MSALKIENLRVRSGGFEASLPRLEVQPGRFACLVGKSGAGKTTLLNAIGGFLSPLQGTISLGTEELTPLPAEKRRAAMVFQRGALFPHLTVLENVAYGLRLQGRAAEEARPWLEKFQIAELASRKPHQISVGQAQRVGIARALAVNFPILLLDEPFASLDPATATALRRVLGETVRQRKICAVLVTHFEEDLKELADEVYCISAGKLLWAGDPKGLNFSDPSLRKSLFGPADTGESS